MFIATRDTKVIAIHEVEWQCRRKVKGQNKSEYWAWLATITTQDEHGHDVVTYPSEDFTIVECTDEDVQARLNQFGDYVNSNRSPNEALVYNITWSDSKDTFVMTTDMDGKSVKVVESEEKDEDPKSETYGEVTKTHYKMSHFSGNDSDKNARLLADKWKSIRLKRNRLLAETDYLALSDQTLSSEMSTYRQNLRDVPTQSNPDNITWPTKP